ncbi:MAG: hypothetical protein CMJ83_21370 [Planctomycetes bacterium]|nr:hypothetical protein [Planctomycetota bacterium]
MHLLCALLVLTSAAALPAQSTYVDHKYGYSIKSPEGWDAVPPQPTEKYVVSKWVSKRHIRDLPAEVHVYVFNRKAEKGYGDEMPAAAAEILERFGNKKSYADWMRSGTLRSKQALAKGRKLKIKYPKGHPPRSSTIFTTTRPSGYSRGAQRMPDFFVMIGVIETENVEYAVECFCSVKAERKLRGRFQSVIKSFKLLEPPTVTTTGPAANGKDGYERTKLTPKEEARKLAREQVARTKGWWYLETPRYMIVTNVKKTEKTFIKDIGRRMEAIRDRYEKDFPPASGISAVSIVRVCKDRKSYSDYGGPGGSAGYWYSAAKELVFFREGDTEKPFQVLNHEAFHQYIFYACGSLSPHSWYNEGYGDYYAGADIRGKRVSRIKKFLWRKDTIKNAVRRGTHVPIKDIIKYSQSQYYSNSALCYAEGWSIVYFLNTALPKSHRWRKILPTYLEVLQKTKDKNKAVEQAFEGVDLDKFEKAWAAYTVRGTKVRK